VSERKSTEIFVTIQHDHPSLPGHFPGNPVVPGVVILGQVLDAIRADERASICVLEARTVKFHSPLQPNKQLCIALNPRDGENRDFSCREGTTLIASGQLRYRVMDTAPQESA